jgi:3-deoxy-manno-octulosonate cytidylyltransferase (CMP-KDO synthetase)
MKNLAIIPARMSASRYPGKPMVEILGIPMIGHCFLRTKMSELIDHVYVATCDEIIYNYIISIGGNAVMTSNNHERATERSAEALLKIEESLNLQFDNIVMVQGDEPLVFPEQIDKSIKALEKKKFSVSNLMKKLEAVEDINNPNNVKVVFNNFGKALYMSRSVIPSEKKFSEEINYFRQLGLIAFSRESLLNFIELKPSRLEIIESVDMNRFLENGVSIKMVETLLEVDAIDVPSDLVRVESKMKKDILFKKYFNEN